MADTQRVFFALWPPDEVAENLHGTTTALVQELTSGQCMPLASLHMTLAFVGDVNATQCHTLLEIGEHLAMPAMTLHVDHIAHWAHNRILWAGLAETPPALVAHVERLRAALRAAGLPFADEHDFTPHLTLMRRAPAIEARALSAPLIWRVEAWCLAASAPDAGRGRYRQLCRWPARAD